MGRGQKYFKKYDRKTLDCLEYAVSRNTVINNLVSDDSEGNEHREEMVGSNMDIKGFASEVSGGNEDRVIGNRKKEDPCIGTEILEGLCPLVMQKRKLVIMNLDFQAKS